MTQVSPAPSISGSPAIRQIPSGNGGQEVFSLALTGAEPPRAIVPVPVSECGDAEAEARQALAGTGKDLPDPDLLADGEDDRAEIDAPFVWFGLAPVAPEPAPAIVVAGQPDTVALAPPQGKAAPLPEIMLPQIVAPEGVAPAVAAPGIAAPDVGASRIAVPEVATPEIAMPVIVLPEGFAAQPVEAAADPLTAEVGKAIAAFDRAASTPTPTSTPASASAAASASAEPAPVAEPQGPSRRIAGIDISRLSRTGAPVRIALPATAPILQTLAALQPRAEANPLTTMIAPGIVLPEQFRTAPRGETVAALTPLNGLEMQRHGVVQAVAEVQQAVIDTRRDDWMSATIERIEALRDSPNSRETSLRLSPDALGKVDVSIRQEGDRVHVRFTAETAAARTLLTEAQSRLNDIAEARGLKLGQTSVESSVNAGTSGQGQRHDAAPKSNAPIAPASALAGETETTTDQRVA